MTVHAPIIAWLNLNKASDRSWDGLTNLAGWIDAALDELSALGFSCFTATPTLTGADLTTVMDAAAAHGMYCFTLEYNATLGFGVEAGNACHGWQTTIKYILDVPVDTGVLYDDEARADILLAYGQTWAGVVSCELYHWYQVHSDYLTAFRAYCGGREIIVPFTDGSYDWWYGNHAGWEWKGVGETPQPISACEFYTHSDALLPAHLAYMNAGPYWPGSDGITHWCSSTGGGRYQATYARMALCHAAGFNKHTLLYTDTDLTFWDWATVATSGFAAARTAYLTGQIVPFLEDYGVMGSYRIYHNAGAGPVDYGTVIDTLPGHLTSWKSGALAYPKTWRLGIRAFNATGEEKNVNVVNTVILDGTGADASAKPNSPHTFQASPAAGATVRLDWGYDPQGERAACTGFNVYYDAGSGNVNYATALATVTKTAQDWYRWTSNALTDGVTYKFAVRASAGGIEDTNTLEASAAVDATAPTQPSTLTVTATR